MNESRTPWLKPWLTIGSEQDRVLIQDGERVTTLEGAAVTSGFLPDLLGVLDGTRDVAELACATGVAEGSVQAALSVLEREALLTRGPRPIAELAPEVRGTAYALSALTQRSPTEICSTLTASSVVVAGDTGTARAIDAMLVDAGLTSAARVQVGEVSGLDAVDLLVVAPAADELDTLGEINRLALETSVAWLPIAPYNGRVISVGPLMVPGQTCCWECFRFRCVPDVDALDAFLSPKTPVERPMPSLLDQLAAPIAALLAVRWLATRDAFLPGIVHLVEVVPQIAVSHAEVFRVPRCPSCSRMAGQAPPAPWS